MQHHLALALGCTVEALKGAMYNDEYRRWWAYVEKFGPLNPSLRMEAAIARLAAMWAKDARPSDFMPWPREEEVEATPEMMLGILKANAAPKGKA